MRILIVEDDAETSAFVSRGLTDAGHNVVAVDNGREGLFRATSGEFDALVLDRMVPGLDGLSLVKMLRASENATPVLILTALSGIADRVEGLEVGADDYLVKPFDLSELLARVRALGRRPALQAEPAKLMVGDVEIDLHRHTVHRGGRRIILQPREFALLAELMRNPHRVMTRAMLLERVWDFDFDPKTNIVETHISRLRTKLNADFDTNAIETVRGVGYMLRID